MRVEGTELVISAPSGSITSADKEQLVSLKPEIIALLAGCRFAAEDCRDVIDALYGEASALRGGFLDDAAVALCRLLFAWDDATYKNAHNEWLAGNRDELQRLSAELGLSWTKEAPLTGDELAAAAKRILVVDVLAERAAAAFD